MIKVNKAKARNLYNKGVSIYLLPCKVRLNNIWISPYEININNYPNEIDSFNKHVNAYEYYNCNHELGYYASYYIEGVI